MRATSLPILLLSFALLGGCASAFDKPEPNAYYGEPPTQYETAIPETFSYALKDPYSAHYRFSSPIRGYQNNGLVYGGKVTWKGYMVIAEVNAKNSMGGYTGFKPYTFFFNGEKVSHWQDGVPSGPLTHIASGPTPQLAGAQAAPAKASQSTGTQAAPEPLSREQWKQQQLQKLDQETGLSYEEYQRRYREIVGQ